MPDFQQLFEEELFWAIFSKNKHSNTGARKEETVGFAQFGTWSANKLEKEDFTGNPFQRGGKNTSVLSSVKEIELKSWAADKGTQTARKYFLSLKERERKIDTVCLIC